MGENQILFWRYVPENRNYSGYHLMADHGGFEALRGVLASLGAGKLPSSLPISPPGPDALRIVGNKKGRPTTRSRLLFRLATGDESWVVEHADKIELSLCRLDLECVRRGLDDISAGIGDYAIQIGQSDLWFWWYPGTRKPRAK